MIGSEKINKKMDGIWRTCRVGLSMSCGSLIVSTSVSDDMTQLCWVGWSAGGVAIFLGLGLFSISGLPLTSAGDPLLC